MTHYSESALEQIPREHRSLVVSFANLLVKMESEQLYEPIELYAILTSDDPMLDWWSVAEYIPDIDIKEVNPDENTWPPVSQAIVKFRRLDAAAAGYIDHFCLVADHRVRSIVDPLDGVIKLASTYGTAMGWASYVKIRPDNEQEAKEAKILLEAGNSMPHTYILQPEENLWDAARKLNLKVEDLVKLNEIDDPRSIKSGSRIHLPITEAEEKKVVRYEILDEPVPMHVSRAGGAQKFSFGNATKWDDIIPTGRTHKENTNHNIVAIAHVELENEDTTAAYYMDRVDLGNFKITGLPQFTTGFNHSHLSEGHVIPAALTAPKLDAIEAIDKAEIQAAAMAEDERDVPAVVLNSLDVSVDQLPIAIASPVNYRETLLALKQDHTPMTFMSDENQTIHEVERRRNSRPLRKGQMINLTYTFEKDGVLYGLPSGTEKGELWYAIPMDSVTSEEELYNWNQSLADRVALKKELSTQEQGVVILSKFLSQGTRLRVWIKNRKK